MEEECKFTIMDTSRANHRKMKFAKVNRTNVDRADVMATGIVTKVTASAR